MQQLLIFYCQKMIYNINNNILLVLFVIREILNIILWKWKNYFINNNINFFIQLIKIFKSRFIYS